MTKKDTGPQQEPEKDFEQTELSETWRELLGKRMSTSPQRKPDAHQHGTGNVDQEAEGQKDHERNEEQAGSDPNEASEQTIPTLKSDPWSSLIQAKGVEVVDLHKARLQISDQEVERILKVIQEYPIEEEDDETEDLS